MTLLKPSRRDILKMSAAAPMLGMAAPALANIGGPNGTQPSHFRFTLGEARLTVVSDGYFTSPIGTVGVNADPEEVKEAHEEGIEILDARGPQEIVLTKGGRISGLRTWKVISIFDDQGRFSPSYDEADEMLHKANMVIEAIGQASDVELQGDELTEALEWDRGRLSVDAEGRTSQSWLWAAGDCVHGPDIIHAVADGHVVAHSIDAALNEQEEADAKN
ncbi:MAG TPA: hypothetical protein EYP10_07820 [Armatimonadetes bacterium]|nr:hypothetical protein [Armatimonadota bacterium]